MDHEAGEVVTGAHTSEDETPDYYTAGDIFCWWEDLEESIVDGDGWHVAGVVDGS